MRLQGIGEAEGSGWLLRAAVGLGWFFELGVPTPGSGIEPGLAFRVAPNGTMTR
jgi:hypothetical protein